jgi:cyclic pyranopterin phosphate synthase
MGRSHGTRRRRRGREVVPILDRLQRPLGAVRISVTDRCNLRCSYCMPEDEYAWLPRESLLSFEEIARLARIFAQLGAGKIRLTGGEPLLRRDLDQLVGMVKAIGGVREVALTTNALLLKSMTARLKTAGLDRITVSLDTLHPERMAVFAKSAHHADVIGGIDAAIAGGFAGLKINSVVVRGYNDDEVVALAEFARGRGIEPRYIEYMDVGGATRWRAEDVVSREEIVAALEQRFGAAEPMTNVDDPHAPAQRFRFADGTVAGIISSTTTPFCRDCDRARVTADGTMFLCLYADQGVDLREPLRSGATDDQLAALIRSAWEGRADRGAEARLAVGHRGVLVPLQGLRADPRREMHVRGG